MTNKDLQKQINKMEEVIDLLLETLLNESNYNLMRYHFSIKNYDELLKDIERIGE